MIGRHHKGDIGGFGNDYQLTTMSDSNYFSGTLCSIQRMITLHIASDIANHGLIGQAFRIELSGGKEMIDNGGDIEDIRIPFPKPDILGCIAMVLH
jgi:hypothetical protein